MSSFYPHIQYQLAESFKEAYGQDDDELLLQCVWALMSSRDQEFNWATVVAGGWALPPIKHLQLGLLLADYDDPCEGLFEAVKWVNKFYDWVKSGK